MNTTPTTRHTLQEIVILAGAYLILFVFCAIIVSATTSEAFISKYLTNANDNAAGMFSFLVFFLIGFCIFTAVRYVVKVFRNIRIWSDQANNGNTQLTAEDVLGYTPHNRRSNTAMLLTTNFTSAGLCLFFITFIISLLQGPTIFNAGRTALIIVTLTSGIIAYCPFRLISMIRRIGTPTKFINLEKALIVLNWINLAAFLYLVIFESQFEFFTTVLLIATATFEYCLMNSFAKAFHSLRQR